MMNFSFSGITAKLADAGVNRAFFVEDCGFPPRLRVFVFVPNKHVVRVNCFLQSERPIGIEVKVWRLPWWRNWITHYIIRRIDLSNFETPLYPKLKDLLKYG